VQITVRRRPIGITILAIAAFVLGLPLGLLGLFLTAFGALAALGAWTANSPTMAFGAALAGASVAFGLLFLVFGLLCLGFAIGAWRLRPWARRLGLIGSGLGIAGSLSSYSSAATLGTVAGGATGALVALAVSVAIMVYLLTPGVRRAFGL